MRVIDADELVRDIDELSKDAGFYRPIYEGFKNCINFKQTIDAVPVVRCKDCVNGTFCLNSQGADYVDCMLDDYSVRKPDDFCSYGDLKEGADG